MRNLLLISATVLLLNSCSSNKENSYYAMEKKYWDVLDYKLAITQININNLNQEELPNLDNPSTAPIFQKLADTSNIYVVASDNQLGVAHKASFTSEMFDQYKSVAQAYAITDRTDKYKYAKEYAELLKFGLYMQLYYIQTNNDKILKEADNLQDPEVIRVTTSNQNILINNFNIYLDHINREDQFTEQALTSFASGIDLYFPRLLSVAPRGNYSPMLEKVNNMLGKSKNQNIKSSLERLKALLQTKKGQS